MKNHLPTIICSLVVTCSSMGCLLNENDELAEATEAIEELGIEGTAVSETEDPLSGSWNLRPDGAQAWYAGAELVQCSQGTECPSTNGTVTTGDFLDTLCESQGFCLDTNIPMEFELDEARHSLSSYTMSSDALSSGFHGVLVHRLGAAVFDIGAGYATYDGPHVDAVGGYASQLGMTPTRPEIDARHDGPYDGVLLIEFAGGVSIEELIIPVGGVVIAIPFDAVSCDLYPDDCTR